jgi:CDP-6-deoxy-D-xylo-4-hexulose-3-dehydrase
MLISNQIKKSQFINKIEKLGIETRPIISGNFLKQPSIKKYKLNTLKVFKNADVINKCGFFIGLPTSKISHYKIKKMVNIFAKSL